MWRGRVWLARAWWLVEERPDLVVLANRPGSETRVPVDAGGARMRIPADEWRLVESRWESWTLRLARPGQAFSTLLFFDERGEFRSWYANLERPLERTPFGFDTLDWKLDVVASRDGTVRLKDEGELAAAARAGAIDEAQVRALAQRIVRHPPWPTGWESHPPDPELEPAALPVAWEVVKLETERLVLTPLAPADADFYGGGEGGAQGELARSAQSWRGDGFGFWAVRERDGGDVVAVCEAHRAGHGVDGIGPDEVEVGWLVDERHRNRGVATEAMRAVIADLFQRCRLACITAYVRSENEPSHRVAAKLGFAVRRSGRARDGAPTVVYELRR